MALSNALARITTRDILAVITVGAALVFNGISLILERGVEAATMTLAGAVVGYYFNTGKTAAQNALAREDPLPEPLYGDADKR